MGPFLVTHEHMFYRYIGTYVLIANLYRVTDTLVPIYILYISWYRGAYQGRIGIVVPMLMVMVQIL